jgi:hypothetical protein
MHPHLYQLVHIVALEKSTTKTPHPSQHHMNVENVLKISIVSRLSQN